MIVLFRRILAAAVAVLAVAFSARAETAEVSVERISFTQSHDGRTLVARVHTSDRVRAYAIDQEGATLDVILYRARVAPSLERESAQGPIRGYRVEAGEDRVTLRFQVDPSVQARAYPDRDSDDLLLSFSDVPRPQGGWSAPAAPVTPVASPSPAVSAPAASSGEGMAEVATAPPVLPASSAHWRLDTIVLDAGHGDHDYGARGNGTSDKEVALGVVQRLGPMLERELGVNVVYTRTGDTFVELRERGRIANRSGGKLFISVHGNAGPSSAYGTETFFLAPRGQGNARSVMERENSVIELESNPELYADFHDEDNILQSLAMSAYQEESQHLARLIEAEFKAAGRHSRGVKQDNFMVLWAASMPAVLVEVGFVTNRDEARLISSPEGQEQTARAIFNAVRAYKASYERGLRVAGAAR